MATDLKNRLKEAADAANNDLALKREESMKELMADIHQLLMKQAKEGEYFAHFAPDELELLGNQHRIYCGANYLAAEIASRLSEEGLEATVYKKNRRGVSLLTVYW